MRFDFMRLNFMDIDVMGMDFAWEGGTNLDFGIGLIILSAPIQLYFFILGCMVLLERPKGQRAGGAKLFFGLPVAAMAAFLLFFYTLDLQEQLQQAEIRAHNAAVQAEREAKRKAYLAAKQAAAPDRMGDEERLNELCDNAGVFVHRKATEVEGVFLMKPRPALRKDRMGLWAQDPYNQFLDHYKVEDATGYIYSLARTYSYVDAVAPEDGKRYRHTRVETSPQDKRTGRRATFTIMRREVTPDMPKPRYGITWEDITEREDRERYWIAGGSLKVIDLENGEVMGERIGYMLNEWQEGKRAPDWWDGSNLLCHEKGRVQRKGRVERYRLQRDPYGFVVAVIEPKKFEYPVLHSSHAEK